MSQSFMHMSTIQQSNTKKSIAPKLRFKEFNDDWNNQRLADLSTVITKGTTPSSFSGKGINFIKIEGLEGIYIRKERCLFINQEIHEGELRRSILKEGDILFAIAGATIGKVALVTVDILPANTNQALAIIRLNEVKSINFILQILQSWIMKRYIKLSIVTGAQPNLNLEQIGNFSFNLPSLPEQQKIASFLSAVDEKIQQLTRKKQLLEQYKKGVMQQLFSGKLRFKDENGKDYPKWEVKRLGDVGEIITGKTPRTSDIDLWGGDVLFVTPTDMLGNKYQVSTQRTVKGNKLRILPTKTIMFTCIASIGKMSLSLTPSVTNQQINSIIPYEQFDNEYVYYSLLSIADEIKSTQSTTTLPIINKTEFSKFRIQVPQSLKEQQKIATFLSTMDAKIESVAKQINHTQLFKKGLLQQMFV